MFVSPKDRQVEGTVYASCLQEITPQVSSQVSVVMEKC